MCNRPLPGAHNASTFVHHLRRLLFPGYCSPAIAHTQPPPFLYPQLGLAAAALVRWSRSGYYRRSAMRLTKGGALGSLLGRSKLN